MSSFVSELAEIQPEVPEHQSLLVPEQILDNFEDFENCLSQIVLRINQKLQNTNVSCIEFISERCEDFENS